MSLVEHPHAQVVRSLIEAFSQQDRAGIEARLDPACVWRVPGDNGLAGVYVGRDAVMGLFRTLKRLFSAPARFEVLDVTTSETRVCVLQIGIVTVNGRELRMKECLVYRLEGGVVVEVDEYQADQSAFDAAFTHAVVASANA